jgi:hypothetical protein
VVGDVEAEFTNGNTTMGLTECSTNGSPTKTHGTESSGITMAAGPTSGNAEKTDDSTETTARRVAAARLTATDWGGDGARRAEARSEGLQQCSRTAELNVRQEKALMMTMP